jgi:hypothetical protein
VCHVPFGFLASKRVCPLVQLVPTRVPASSIVETYRPQTGEVEAFPVSPGEAAAAARATNVPIYDPQAMARIYRRQPLKVSSAHLDPT